MLKCNLIYPDMFVARSLRLINTARTGCGSNLASENVKFKLNVNISLDQVKITCDVSPTCDLTVGVKKIYIKCDLVLPKKNNISFIFYYLLTGLSITYGNNI